MRTLPALLVSLALSAPAPAQQLLDRVMARVGTTSIMLSDVLAAIGIGLVELPAGEDAQAVALRQLIERELAMAEVTRFAPDEPEAAAVEQEAARLRGNAGMELNRLMRETGLDEARIRDLARENLRLQAYLNQRFGVTVQVTDDEVEAYYRENPGEFTRNGMLLSFEEAEPLARQRASARRRSETVAQWLRDLRARGAVTLPRSRP
jgi:hypothetical protein